MSYHNQIRSDPIGTIGSDPIQSDRIGSDRSNPIGSDRIRIRKILSPKSLTQNGSRIWAQNRKRPGHAKKWHSEKPELHSFEQTLSFWEFFGSVRAPTRAGNVQDMRQNDTRKNQNCTSLKKLCLFGNSSVPSKRQFVLETSKTCENMTLEKNGIAHFWKHTVFLGILRFRQSANSCWKRPGHAKKWHSEKRNSTVLKKTLSFWEFFGSIKAPIRAGNVQDMRKNETWKKRIAQFWKKALSFWAFFGSVKAPIRAGMLPDIPKRKHDETRKRNLLSKQCRFGQHWVF